jgi:hypothetical protein
VCWIRNLRERGCAVTFRQGFDSFDEFNFRVREVNRIVVDIFEACDDADEDPWGIG